MTKKQSINNNNNKSGSNKQPPQHDSSDDELEQATNVEQMSPVTQQPLPFDAFVAVGTYDGVLAGWHCNAYTKRFNIYFATPVHEGSVRSLSITAAAANSNNDDDDVLLPGTLLSCGYDEVLKTHDFDKNCTSSGEIHTSSDTPVCSAFAPPTVNSTHCLVGFGNGSLVLYKKKDWTIPHVMAGHSQGVASLAVHPSGKLALSGGQSDGKIKCWDLTKGRLAYACSVVRKSRQSGTTTAVIDPIVSLVWSATGDAYAWCHGNHITVRDVASGQDLLDVDVLCRVNQICLFYGNGSTDEQHLFVAAACNDGSMPVLAAFGDENRRAIMAIEPAVDTGISNATCQERFKCIQAVESTTFVVTANSVGVVSLWNLQGAVNILTSPEEDDDDSDEDDDNSSNASKQQSDSEQNDDDSEGELEMAAEFIDGIQLGSGARITCLSVFAATPAIPADLDVDNAGLPMADEQIDKVSEESDNDGKDAVVDDDNATNSKANKRKRQGEEQVVVMDPQAVERARELVAKAKSIQARTDKKRQRKSRNG